MQNKQNSYKKVCIYGKIFIGGFMNVFEGNVVEIIFRNEENGYTVGVLETADEYITFVGTFVAIQEGDILKLKGNFKNHNTYGRQIEVISYEIPKLETDKSIFNYLASGAIDDIGIKLAERIVNKFGKDTLEIMENEPERLLEVEGIGKKKLIKIISSYSEKTAQRNILMKIMEYDLSSQLALKIYKKFGAKTVEILEKNPYLLAGEISGIGFLKADEIARKTGFDLNSVLRVKEGIKFTLEEICYQGGSTYVLYDELKQKSLDILETDEDKYDEALYEIAIEKSIVIEECNEEIRVYLQNIHSCEQEIAYKLLGIATSENKFVMDKTPSAIISESEDRIGKKLAENQKEAVITALENKIMVLTGGPGTGKTTIISFIIDCFKTIQKKIKLAAPTGRAAKRMSEASEMEAVTIHRLLEVGFNNDDDDANFYNRNEENPIDAEVVIIDEVSMVDIFLMRALLSAIKKGTTVIFVGDKDQLQSVGVGRVLCDIIDSGVIKTVTLNEIFRQSKESNIIINAHNVNNGKSLAIDKSKNDFFFMQREYKEDAQNLVVELLSERLPKYFDVTPKEIQVLSPIKKSKAGVYELNKAIQEKLNPYSDEKKEFKSMDRILRVGDKIMQIKNNYEKEYTIMHLQEVGKGVFNGDIGYISSIDLKVKEFYIMWEDKRVSKYTFEEADNIEHSYAMTVHKSQGSEFDIVIIPILSLPPMMQSRNILYTALTRAKKVVVLVGSMQQIEKMIEHKSKDERRTSLSERLRVLNNLFNGKK